MSYFVMLNTRSNEPIPMVNSGDKEDIAHLFATEAEARGHAEQNLLAKAYGYEIYEWLWD